MRSALLLKLLTATAVLSVLTSVQAQRVHTRLDAGWKFYLEPSSANAANDIPEWKWHPIDGAPNTTATMINLSGDQGWQRALSGQDVFHGRKGFAWFEAVISRRIPAGKIATTVLHFDSVDDNATVYINGRLVTHHEGWNDQFDVPLQGWKPNQDNVVDVLDENTDGPGGIAAVRFTSIEAMLNPIQAKPGFADKPWRTVHLPHDYVIEGTFQEAADAGHGALPRGAAWYRKSFTLPKSAKGKSVWVDFDGAYSDAHVWFNGVYLGAHGSGYTGFRFDLASFAHYGGSNVLAVHLDARKTEGWWYEGGGIYRHVWLTIADKTHVSPYGGVYVTAKISDPLGKPKALISAQLEVDNTADHDNICLLKSSVIDPTGRVVTGAETTFNLKPKQTGITIQQMVEPKAKLWSLEHPTLYTFRTSVLRNGKVIDSVDTPFGLRTIRFDAAKGFFLNERPVKLKGTCNHQDFAGVGTGMPDSVLAWRIKKLQSMGSNAYRCSHNEVASELLDACDRLGMLVMDENREFGDTYAGKAGQNTTANDLSDFKQEILRDRNHPSVIMWSVANEEFAVQVTPTGGRIGAAMVAVAHSLDPTRPATAALNGGHGSYLSKVLDLEGFNYGPSGYVPYHKANPNHPMFGSETASTTTTRGIYARDNVRGYVPAYDTQGADTAEAAWEPIAREPYNEGGFVWTGFDYKGEPSPFGWPCVNSHFGILDEAGFPKDIFYYYKAWWGAAPLVHVFPHWNWPGMEGQPIDVWVFSNGDAVELFLNGKSLGRKANPAYEHLSWSVPYTPGKLTAKAYKNGKLIGADAVETTGAPAALKVVTDRTKLVGDNEDTTMLEVAVLDAAGRVVPTASNDIAFEVVGPAWVAGVGNGDPSCHEPDRASTRHAFNGYALGLIQAKNKSGKVTVRVTSPGLKSVVLTLQVTAAKD